MSETAIVSLKEYARSPEIVERFAEVVGKQNAGGYISSVLLAVAVNNSLQRCDPKSIISAALRAATLRLSCDPGIGQAYPVPFKGKAVLVIGYKGLINMATRTGKYRFINAGPIFEGEEFVEDRITGLGHIGGSKKSHTVIGYVASFQLVAGYGKTIYMSVEEIHELAKRYSKSYTNPDSAWKTNTSDMERKTILRRLITRWGYLDPSDAMLVTEHVDDDYIEGEEMYGLPAPEDVTVIPPEPLTGSVDDLTRELYGIDPPVPDNPAADAKSDNGEDVDIRAMLANMAKQSPTATDVEIQRLAAYLDKALKNRDYRLQFLSWVQGKSVKSAKDLDKRLTKAIFDWLDITYDSNGGAFYAGNLDAEKAIIAAHTALLVTAGQETLI